LPPKQKTGFHPVNPDDQVARPREPTEKGKVNIMKQFVQNSKVFRTIFGRFVALAVLTAAAFTLTPRVQAAPGKGAVVTFITRDGTLVFTAFTPDFTTFYPDGQLKLEIAFGAPGDFIRANPDGTLSVKVTATQAPLTISVLADNGEWIPALVGTGLFHSTDLVEPVGDGSYISTGQAGQQSYEFQLTRLADGSQWSLHAVVVDVNYEIKVFKIDFQPR
jgi:hypothetical protein